jgi:hypothetical protein
MYAPLEESPPKLHIFIYLASAIILAVFCVIDLALHEWFEYCYWHIGLVYADSNNDLSTYSGENSISNAHDDACDGKTNKSSMQTICPDLCDNLKKFETAGGLMIAFSVLTFISLIVVIGMHLVLLFKKQLRFKFAWLFMILPLLTYMLGFIIFCATADVSGIRGTKSHSPSPRDFEWKGGMIFAVIIIIFMGFNLVHGMIFTRKYLLVDK